MIKTSMMRIKLLKRIDSFGQLELLVSIVAGLILGYSLVSSRHLLFIALVCLIFFVAVFLSHHTGVVFLFVSVFFLPWFSEYLKIVPRESTLFIELMIGILFCKVLFLKLSGKQWKRTPIDKLVVLVVFFSLLSALINFESPVVVMLGFRKFFKYILLFYILINLDLEEKFYRKMLKMLMIIAIIQIPVAIIEWLIVGVGDNVVGTLGANATGLMGIFMAFIACLFLGFYLHEGKVFNIVFIVSLFVPVVLGSGRFGFIAIPSAVLFSLLTIKQWDVRKFIRIVCATVIVVVAIWGAIDSHDRVSERGQILGHFTSLEDMFDYTTGYAKGGILNRTEAVIFANGLISQNPSSFILGFGPGSASPSFIGFAGDLEKKYSDLRIWGVQLSWTLLEYGFLGLILFIGLFIVLFRFNSKFYLRIDDNFWKAIAFGYNGLVFVMIISISYMTCWVSDVLAFTFWFLSAAIVSVSRESRL